MAHEFIVRSFAQLGDDTKSTNLPTW